MPRNRYRGRDIVQATLEAVVSDGGMRDTKQSFTNNVNIKPEPTL